MGFRVQGIGFRVDSGLRGLAEEISFHQYFGVRVLFVLSGCSESSAGGGSGAFGVL